MAYERELEWNEPPTVSERRYARWAVVRAARAPATSMVAARAHRQRSTSTWRPPGQRARRAGAVGHAGRRGQARAPRRRRLRGRGRPRQAGRVATRRGRRPPRRRRVRIRRPPGRRAPAATERGSASRSSTCRSTGASRPLPGARREDRFRVGLPGDGDDRAARAPTMGARPRHQHGRRRARAVVRRRTSVCSRSRAWRARRGRTWRRSISPPRSRPRSGDWRADVVLVAMSDGAWGTPPYLRDVLREAARCGRGGRGARDLLLGRRSVAQPCPPGRQRRAGR